MARRATATPSTGWPVCRHALRAAASAKSYESALCRPRRRPARESCRLRAQDPLRQSATCRSRGSGSPPARRPAPEVDGQLVFTTSTGGRFNQHNVYRDVFGPATHMVRLECVTLHVPPHLRVAAVRVSHARRRRQERQPGTRMARPRLSRIHPQAVRPSHRHRPRRSGVSRRDHRRLTFGLVGTENEASMTRLQGKSCRFVWLRKVPLRSVDIPWDTEPCPAGNRSSLPSRCGVDSSVGAAVVRRAAPSYSARVAR
jgi:hypothetical protein